MIVHTFNPITQEAEAGELFWVQDRQGYIETCLKQQNHNKEAQTRLCVVYQTRLCVETHITVNAKHSPGIKGEKRFQVSTYT